MSELEAVAQSNKGQNEEHSAGLRFAELQRQSAKEFLRAFKCAKKAVAKDKCQLAVEWCRYAASIAWSSFPGFFYSHDIEQLLAEIGRAHLGPASAPSPSERPGRRFLHVMTVAYETGGHTRVVSNWIETCAQISSSEQHSVLVSKQGETPVPSWLVRSAQRTGGALFVLPPIQSWLQTAEMMRTTSLGFDVIILHTHPNDPLPNLAFHDRPRPVIFFNHSDHTFTLGMDTAKVVADLRPFGLELSKRFRAPAPQKVMLPLPLHDQGPANWDRTDARRKLGLPADALIALTIGERYKFTPMHGYSFPALVQSLCAGNPRVLIVAVGISESDPFPGLGQLVEGRFMPVGVIKDRDILELYYRAADIYLDSFPCTSLTAVLDAARHSLPVQRLCNPHLRLMWCDDPGLDSVMPGVVTQDEYVAEVLEWLRWPETKRSELGSRFRSSLLREHCGASWKDKWLDPAVNALSLDGVAGVQPRHEGVEERQDDYLALTAARWDDRPASMLIAVTILETPEVDLSIRISGVWHSILPWLFDTAHDGMKRKRFFVFKSLVKSVLPRPVVIIGSKLLHPVLKAL